MARNTVLFVRAMLVLAMLMSWAAKANEGEPFMAGLQAYLKPAFPAELRATEISDGYATVAFTVAADGHVDDAVTLYASHLAFGKAVLAALSGWRLVPESAETFPRREIVRFDFRRVGMIGIQTHFEATKGAFSTPLVDAEVTTLPWDALEIQPQRLAMVAPVIPRSLTSALRDDRVTVNFIIDLAGRVRVPAVTRTTEPQLAKAVIAAIKQWQFTPPMHRGKAVGVELSKTFALHPPP